MDADFDWSPIDELIFPGTIIKAALAYRDRTGASFREAVDAVRLRALHLRAAFPERLMYDDPRYIVRHIARQALARLTEPVLAIEALWDGDTSIELRAITGGASHVHPLYTDTFLCRVTSADVGEVAVWEVAAQIQRELAESAKADVHEAPRSPHDGAPRWWDAPDRAAWRERPEARTDGGFDWFHTDELIFRGSIINALKVYRDGTGVTLYQAVDAVAARTARLRAAFPERFPVRPTPREAAQKVLARITEPIRAIEAVWDGDTVHDWFIILYALTRRPSERYPTFDKTWLCQITNSDVERGSSIWEAATRLQRELAESTGAAVKEAPRSPDD